MYPAGQSYPPQKEKRPRGPVAKITYCLLCSVSTFFMLLCFAIVVVGIVLIILAGLATIRYDSGLSGGIILLVIGFFVGSTALICCIVSSLLYSRGNSNTIEA